MASSNLLDPNLGLGNGFACLRCDKRFDKESTYNRHDWYCRRRAAKKKAPRPPACLPCKKIKMKCDSKLPCSRCVKRRLSCLYEGAHGGGSTATMDGPALPLRKTGSAGGGMHAPIPNVTTTTTTTTTTRASPSSRFSAVAPSTATYPDTDTNPLDNWYGLGLPGSHVEHCSSHPHADLFDNDEEEKEESETKLLIPIPAWTMSPLEASAHRRLSPGARRFIISTIRAYPRMMANPENLPPFIHPLSCRVGPEDSYSSCLALHAPDVGRKVATRHPFGLIMTCHGIAQMFLSCTAGEHDLLVPWQRIDIEHKKIQGEMASYSAPEMITGIQVMVIYTIMRLIHMGPEYFHEDRAMLQTMIDLSSRFNKLVPGPYSPPHSRMSRPTWEEWILEETRRRVTILCYLVSLVLGSEGSDALANPFLMPLPSSKTLWEARISSNWEREYTASRHAGKSCHHHLETIGDLAVATMQRGRGLVGVDDALDDWHAGVDGLGMLLSAVIAGV